MEKRRFWNESRAWSSVVVRVVRVSEFEDGDDDDDDVPVRLVMW
jgi:hypothetical protein